MSLWSSCCCSSKSRYSRSSPTGSRNRSRSRSRDSVRRSPSPARPSNALVSSSVLDTSGLEDILARFHGQLDVWLKEESAKLEQVAARGKTSADDLQNCAEKVNGFFRDYASSADLGPDPRGEGFTTRALPHFLELIDEDRRALQEAMGFLKQYADKHFPKNEELASLKAASSPLPLLKALLRLASSAPAAKARGGGRKRRDRAARGNFSGGGGIANGGGSAPPPAADSQPPAAAGRSRGHGRSNAAVVDGGHIRSESSSSVSEDGGL
mmetsp:Transcript_35894/g.94860  ORF Transcript_35894/g.94860 Transcript_35894/m.94860 type:complete len:268 (+) Transcript_35894:313-1116(+)